MKVPFLKDPEREVKDKKAADLKAKAKVFAAAVKKHDDPSPDCLPGETSQARDRRLERIRRKAEQAMCHPKRG